METLARISFFKHFMSSHSGILQPLKTPFLISFLITVVMTLTIAISFFRIQPQVPLFYSLARPSQHLVSKNWLFLLPLLSLLIGLIHSIIVKLTKYSDPLLMKLFAWTTIGAQLMLGLALFRILIIIT